MIKERIILLTERQNEELINRALAANMNDELAFMQMYLNEWLGIRPSAETKLKAEQEGMAEALAKGVNDDLRWSHTEK